MAALALAGCAGQAVEESSALAGGGVAPAPAAPAAPVASYELTPVELKLDCTKLTGQMKVRIATLRGDATAPTASNSSRAMQSAVTPVFGGTKRGIDPAGDIQRDRAKLEAFNKRLAEKKCKTLDIDAELRGETPAAPAKAAPKKAG